MSYEPKTGDVIKFFSPLWANNQTYKVEDVDANNDLVTISVDRPDDKYTMTFSTELFISLDPSLATDELGLTDTEYAELALVFMQAGQDMLSVVTAGEVIAMVLGEEIAAQVLPLDQVEAYSMIVRECTEVLNALTVNHGRL